MRLSFRYRFEAAHRFVHAASPMCQTPHGHTWHVRLQLEAANEELSPGNMVVEFKKLKAQWKKFVQEELDHSFFYNHEDPLAEAMQKHVPGFRGFPVKGDPTTEMLAVLFLRKAQVIFAGEEKVRVQEVLLEETPVNSIALRVTDALFDQTLQALPELAWWNRADIKDRSMKL